MENIEKKTTILLTPALHRKLSKLSRITHKSMGQLFRDAVENQYFSSVSSKKTDILQKMAAMNVPVGEPKEIEQEILRGRLEGGGI